MGQVLQQLDAVQAYLLVADVDLARHPNPHTTRNFAQIKLSPVDRVGCTQHITIGAQLI
jgi:hypothetical protein